MSTLPTTDRAPAPLRSSSTPAPPGAGYARARLRLGIAAVGTMVCLATAGLVLDAPQWIAEAALTGDIAVLAAFVALHALVHLPFDLLGGYVLPHRHGRPAPSLAIFLARLARGVVVASGLLLVAALVLLGAGRAAGIGGVALAGAILVLVLLAARPLLARCAAPLRPVASRAAPPGGVVEVAADDPGFTGGPSGVLRPVRSIVPHGWTTALPAEVRDVIDRRRSIIATSAAWRRGRLLAVGFTIAGIATAAALVGGERLGTAAGTIELGLFFTIWSFVGLLVLPTPSRAGVYEIDAALRAGGVDDELFERTTRELDALQDDEPSRPNAIETIFHPIPSVERRLRRAGPARTPGYWDAARTAIFLGAAGLGLLGRAVHCNCGRPELWCLLPCD